MEEDVMKWMPMCNENEVLESQRNWLVFIKMGCALTVEVDGKIAAMANLYIQTSIKLQKQSLFVIVVKGDYRGKGIGTKLLDALTILAIEKYKIELLHLEVYANNPAIRLYERAGFKRYGIHRKFLKLEDGSYQDKILMQKKLELRQLDGRT